MRDMKEQDLIDAGVPRELIPLTIKSIEGMARTEKQKINDDVMLSWVEQVVSNPETFEDDTQGYVVAPFIDLANAMAKYNQRTKGDK